MNDLMLKRLVYVFSAAKYVHIVLSAPGTEIRVCCSECSVLKYCSVLQCIAVCCSVSQCVAVCCSVLLCVAVCCSVLQYVEVCMPQGRK